MERAEKAVKEAGTEALAGEKVRAELKTERLYRKCAEHSWMSFALLPKAERSPEICLLAAKLYPQETAQRPDLIPESVKNGCNVYSLCKMMEARTGEKFTYQQMTDFYNGKPLNVRRMETPDGGTERQGGEVRQGETGLFFLGYPAGTEKRIADVI